MAEKLAKTGVIYIQTVIGDQGKIKIDAPRSKEQWRSCSLTYVRQRRPLSRGGISHTTRRAESWEKSILGGASKFKALRSGETSVGQQQRAGGRCHSVAKEFGVFLQMP